MGDFNGYTGTENDFLDQTINHLNSSEIEAMKQILPPRANRDHRNINNYSRHLLNLCLLTELYILNGRTGQDKRIREFTCYAGEKT